ncbi:polysaccharide biosynthesis/export family protein [Microvirga sp. BT688]|uniref:polysaccharide biosynthesis/export family protein n=1 Tax=Microvirga sp. TaxID=1873136 RepID=UPI001684AFCB|nr:polysaccharide biosynthesis/export family protein [Microvirga sp.]MBD2750539.1 polysaccharide biosynthesis/export family protein [Microvirga sp.]
MSIISTDRPDPLIPARGVRHPDGERASAVTGPNLDLSFSKDLLHCAASAGRRMISTRLTIVAGLASVCVGLWIASAAAQTAPYRFKAGDLIEVWVAQQQTLNRQVVVRPDGRISLPLAGHIQAEGMTPEDLEAALMQRLQDYFKDRLNLTVMLSPAPEQEPPMIYVAGDIDQPGAYRYRSGMTVLHAVSVAGGFYRAEAEGDRDRDRAIEVRGEFEAAQRQLSSLLVREARLQAELNDRSSVELPAELAAHQDTAVKEILQREQALMDRRRQKYRGQIEAGELLRDTAKREVDAVGTQITTTENQIDLTSRRYEGIKSLVSKGIATDSRLLEIEIALEELKRTKSQQQADLTRAQSTVIQNTASLPDLQNQRQIELQSELQQTKRDLDEARARLETSHDRLSRFDGTRAASDRLNSAPASRHYVILRSEAGSIQEVPATELTQIREGDLIRVDPVPGASVVGARPRRDARRERS